MQSVMCLTQNARRRDEAAANAPIEFVTVIKVEGAALGGDTGAGVGLFSSGPAGG